MDALPGIVAGVAIGLLLFAFVGVDPPTGVTNSTSPFTDEGWHVLNARNAVLLGTWSTDEYNLHLITFPFSAAVAAAFQALGLGIIQARSVAIVATALTVSLLALGLRPVVGRGPALLAGVAFGTSSLVLFYGRLAFLEPVVTLFLAIGFLLVLRVERRHALILGSLTGTTLALAIGSKASAIFAAAGLIGGGAFAAIGERVGRRWLIGTVGAIGLAGSAWMALLAIPNLSTLRAVQATLPKESLPGSVGELVRRVGGYLIHSDGAWQLALPLAIGGIAGAAIGLARWAQLTPRQRRLLVAACAWFVAGVAILFVVQYRPNRYVEPLLPPLAALVALGCAVVIDSARWTALGRPLRIVAAVGVAVALAGQGLALDARWMSSTSSDLLPTQALARSLVPPGSVMQGGYAPILGMTTAATILVPFSGGGVNGGDLYVSRGVRWVVGVPGLERDVPTWVHLHADAWAARKTVLCTEWGGERVCIWSLP